MRASPRPTKYVNPDIIANVMAALLIVSMAAGVPGLVMASQIMTAVAASAPVTTHNLIKFLCSLAFMTAPFVPCILSKYDLAS